MNLQLMVLIDLESGKPELSHFVYEIENECEKIDDNLMKVWKEDEKYKILLNNVMQLCFFKDAILEKNFALYDGTLTEGVEEMIPFFEKYFKETTDELKKNFPTLNGRLFRKDFAYDL